MNNLSKRRLVADAAGEEYQLEELDFVRLELELEDKLAVVAARSAPVVSRTGMIALQVRAQDKVAPMAKELRALYPQLPEIRPAELEGQGGALYSARSGRARPATSAAGNTTLRLALLMAEIQAREDFGVVLAARAASAMNTN